PRRREHLRRPRVVPRRLPRRRPDPGGDHGAELPREHGGDQGHPEYRRAVLVPGRADPRRRGRLLSRARDRERSTRRLAPVARTRGGDEGRFRFPNPPRRPTVGGLTMAQVAPSTTYFDKHEPFTGEEYLESLRDGREIYIYGERVKDVTTHPAFRNTVR